ncbi:hypothetical protein DSM25558_2729 [Agrobacterium sp. DSM 25558]|uniref:hypothetical protein n=1 Tax=Agrobacterium sp. DSM 25558 TaxID=1907665 RepID=UPI0009725AAB|nr:hypothetical protein [Agrobacterium sp. DSM 25558]SCX20358.1 hypothetical protein DSM25558_2729 [Agrobacterium sp. DSM 25558]
MCQKLLVVERKLVSNRGHHHTQIAALRRCLPDYQMSFVAGEDYDGFLGVASGNLSSKSVELAKLRSRLHFGNAFERLGAAFSAAKKRRILKLPQSAFGGKLAEICQAQKLGPHDILIVPTADLYTLESSVELTSILENRAPKVYLRFLSSELGDRNDKIRSRWLNSILADFPKNVFLFTETEELAAYFRREFKMPVESGVYFPCSVQPELPQNHNVERSSRFRIGFFGEPRSEKGSARIAGIVTALAARAETTHIPLLDFVIQGSASNFDKGGIYEGLQKFETSDADVIVSRQDSRISPPEFDQLFRSVDAILLPYDKSVYGLQGSGVIQDAVLAYKPVIYTQGMSMLSFLSHGNGLPATTDEEFADAIIRVATNTSSFQEGTLRAAEYFQNVLATNPVLRSLNV